MAERSADTSSPRPQSASKNEDSFERTDSHGISFNLPSSAGESRPSPSARSSTHSSYHSPLRHHQRTPSRTKDVKETLDAQSHYGSGDDDGAAIHRINQYIIKQEIGRGSFGSVHQAVDQYGNEYAVKEFSKSRLRKRAQSNLLRRPNQKRPGQFGTGLVLSGHLHRHSSSEVGDNNNSLSLIKQEIAIMKKLNHNNLVSLIEVLDDPEEDSLYMVLEICKKGVVMKVGLDERADPYDDETCRCWFRDMILGIEYLHAQGIIHRDIKPDNCLVTGDEVLKIVDFGVSEMFEKASQMATAKSAGSPAFMPPELCVAKHGEVSGRAADIWSMGVTLYCLRYGRIPFEKSSMIELYESIRTEEVPLDEEKDSNFSDLMQRLLHKDPDRRITMDEIRQHPWVTRDGFDPLLSAEENCADIVEPPTEQEMNHAITGNMGNLLAVMKAARRFKAAMHRKHADLLSMFDRDAKLVAPPGTMSPPAGDPSTSESKFTSHDAKRLKDASDKMNVLPGQLIELALQRDAGGEHITGAPTGRKNTAAVKKQQEESARHRPTASSTPSSHHASYSESPTISSPTDRGQVNAESYAKGHAHDPLEDRLFLHIGSDPSTTNTTDGKDHEHPVVSESPSGVEANIFEDAYREEMDRIVEERGLSASMFMNRRVEHRDDIRHHSNIVDAGKHIMRSAAEGLGALQTRGYAAHDAGREAARSALDKLGETDWRGGLDASKAGAKSVANEHYRSAADRFAPKAERAAGKFSDLVSRMQTRQPGAESRKDEGKTGEDPSLQGGARSSTASSILGGLSRSKESKSTG